MAAKKVNRSRAGNIILLIFLLGVSAFMLLPLVYAVSSSLKPMSEFWLFPPTMFPSNPTFDNYKNLVSVMSDSWVPFSRYAFNTLFITVVGTGGHIILSSMCAFSICKLKFPGHQVAFKMIVYSLMFNAAVTAIPNFLVINALGLIDKYSAIILPAFASSMGLYLMKQFMETTVPDSLLEAARIDGAGNTRIFFRIVMPLSKSAWLTLIFFSGTLEQGRKSCDPVGEAENVELCDIPNLKCRLGACGRSGGGDRCHDDIADFCFHYHTE